MSYLFLVTIALTADVYMYRFVILHHNVVIVRGIVSHYKE